jgi:hypothetical protein
MKAEYRLFVSIVLVCVAILSTAILLILFFGVSFGIRIGTSNVFSDIMPVIAVGAIILVIVAACLSLVLSGKSRVR